MSLDQVLLGTLRALESERLPARRRGHLVRRPRDDDARARVLPEPQRYRVQTRLRDVRDPRAAPVEVDRVGGRRGRRRRRDHGRSRGRIGTGSAGGAGGGGGAAGGGGAGGGTMIIGTAIRKL